MKRAWLAVLALSGILLAGCRADQVSPAAEPGQDGAGLPEIGTLSAESGCLEPTSPDVISQEVYEGLEEEWAAWNALTLEQKMVSSHSPGCCRRSFDSWAECEAFLGFAIPNPLEECPWLEQATYVGMPIGFRDAPRVELSWYGTQDGHVEWITADAGYRDGEIRVIVSATIYGDPAETKPADRGWSTELARKQYLENADSGPVQLTSDSSERYLANRASFARGPVLYRLDVIGETNAQAQVEDTVERVIDCFGQESVKQ